MFRAASACCRPGDRGWRPYRAWHSRAFYTAAGEAGGAILNRVVCRADEPGEAASIGLVTIYADATPDPPVEICPSAEE